MSQYYDKLNSLRSQKETGPDFDFRGAVYTIIPENGTEPKFMQPLYKKGATEDLVNALREADANGDLVIAAWIGKYRTDMFLIDDMETVIKQLS